MFDEVTKREGGRRAARRLRYLLGSSAVQVAVVGGIVSLSAAIPAEVSEGPLVPVEIVRPVAPARPPAPPPPPPKPKAAPRPKRPPKTRPPSPTAMVQPKETPAEPMPPEPALGPEEEGPDEGVEHGVIGGMAGGVIGGISEPSKPAGPVELDTAMTPPVLVSGPPLEYTQQALDREIEGVMVVECVITAEGKVHACRVVRGLPFMDRAVLSNLERRRYQPATLEGRPLDVRYTFTIRLKLPR